MIKSCRYVFFVLLFIMHLFVSSLLLPYFERNQTVLLPCSLTNIHYFISFKTTLFNARLICDAISEINQLFLYCFALCIFALIQSSDQIAISMMSQSAV